MELVFLIGNYVVPLLILLPYEVLMVWDLEWQRIGDVSKEIKRVRAQMEENEQVAILMRGLRGQNLSDSQFADENIQLRLVEVCVLL